MTSLPGGGGPADRRDDAPPGVDLEEARNTFIDVVREQVNTPLTLMLGPLRESLADPLLSREQRHRLALAHRAALRLLNLVDGLDDLSRIELGMTRAGGELIDLRRLVTEVVGPFQTLMSLAGLELVVDGEPDVLVRCDRDLLEKAVLHLVSNAFKHTRDGEVRVRVGRAGDAAEVAVADTGVGIPESELGRVFERLYRVRAAWARTEEGAGLGLALVRAVAEAHGGGVRVESRVGVGSTFTVSLPAGPAGAAAVPAAPALPLAGRRLLDEAATWDVGAGAETARRRPALHVSGRERPRIVLIEASADLRAHLLNVLAESWDVEGVSDGAEALARIQRDPPDLVLAEVMAAGMDGLALLQALREGPATAMVPVMLIASRPGEEAAVEALERGPDDYLVKPFTGRLLVARVRANLASARARRRHQAQLQASLEISRATLAGERPEDVLELVARRARDLLDADGAHVAVPGAGGGRQVVSVGEGCDSDEVAAAVQSGADLGGEAMGGGLLAVAPLAVQDRRIGVLAVCREEGRGGFGREDARLLTLFASQAALAMEQGRVHQEMRRLTVMEEERNRIARDIHDDTLQALGAITLRLSLLAGRAGDDAGRRSIEGLIEVTRDSADRLRTLVFGLRADVLQRGLVEALRSYAFEAPTPLPMRCRVVSRLRREPPMHVSLVLYRVVQEALTNVRKHAQATSARITLDEMRGGVLLRVHDDGRGFDPGAGAAAPGHLGLAGMRERAELAGGTWSVESGPGRGTTVRVWIPV